MTTPNGTPTNATPGAETSGGRVRDGIDDIRTRASSAYDTAKDKVADAAAASRDTMGEAAQATVDAVEANPLGIVAGGIALGAVVAALLPRTAREKELLAPVGKRVSATAVAALAAAKRVGIEELDARGLTKDAAKDQLGTLVKQLLKTAKSAGKAAAEAGREKATNK